MGAGDCLKIVYEFKCYAWAADKKSVYIFRFSVIIGVKMNTKVI